MAEFESHTDDRLEEERAAAEAAEAAAAAAAAEAEAALPDPAKEEWERLVAIENWITDRSDGIPIRDLLSGGDVVKSLREMKLRCNQSAQSMIFALLEITAKPFIELKSNEKLTSAGKEAIEFYLLEITGLLTLSSVQIKLAVLRTLRCIANGGVDPTLLSEEQTKYFPEDTRARVVDVDYLLTRLHSAGCLQLIVDQFAQVAVKLDYSQNSEELARRAQSQNSSAVQSIAGDDELAWYGLPGRGQQSANQQEPEEEPSPAADDSPGTVDFESLELAPVATLRELSQRLLDLGLDLAVSGEGAATLSELGICGPALLMLQKDIAHDPRDRRIATWLELLWTALESFLEQARSDQTQGDRRRYLLMKNDFVVDVAFAVSVLKTLLLHLLQDGFKQFDKECRNEVVIVLAMLAEFPESVGHFLSSGMFDILVTYACVEEAGHGSWAYFLRQVANSRNFGTTSDIDLEFKKQIWVLLSTLLRSNDPDALLCFAASPMMPVLLQYLEREVPDAGPGTIRRAEQSQQHTASFLETRTLQSPSGSVPHPWDEGALSKSLSVDELRPGASSRFKPKTSTMQMSTKHTSREALGLGVKRGLVASLTPTKLKEFQVQAVLFLVHHAPKVLGEFERLDGPARALALALKLCRADSAEQKSVVLNCLLLLYRCLCNSVTVRAQLEESQAIQALLYLFGNCLEEEARAQAVRVISCLCSRGNLYCQTQLLHAQGLQGLLQPLRQYVMKRPAVVGLRAGLKINVHVDGSAPIPDPGENPFSGEISVLVVALLDCLKEAVVGNARNEVQLADLEGLDALLDLLEISPFVLRLQILRLLADLLANPKLVVFANVWRSSKTLRSAAQLLCHAWMDEEARLDSERRDQGVVCDLFNPLQSQRWAQSESDKNLVLLTRAVPGTKESFAQSVTVNKLATAILAGRNAVQTNLPLDVCKKALDCDQRVVAAALLRHLGLFELYDIQGSSNPFKEPDGGGEGGEDGGDLLVTSQLGQSGPQTQASDAMLSPRERQVLVLAKKLQALREGEWWKQVELHVKDANVVPIDADAAIMNQRLEAAFDAAVAAQTEQMSLVEVDHAMKKEGEDQHMDQILTKKHQQIKAEWLKRRTRNGKSSMSKSRTNSATATTTV